MTTTKTPPTTARSKRPIFSGQRITVFEWMLDELMKMLGPLANDFDLDEWFWTADALAMKETVVATDWWAWLKHATVEEARRRGLPIASNPALMGKQTTRLAMAVANIKAREAAERDAR